MKSKPLETDALLATRKYGSLESMSLQVIFLFRGGIAVVWLGQKNNEYVAMKQFPKQGNQCDTSAIVEL